MAVSQAGLVVFEELSNSLTDSTDPQAQHIVFCGTNFLFLQTAEAHLPVRTWGAFLSFYSSLSFISTLFLDNLRRHLVRRCYGNLGRLC